jgi:hypothetical protein
MEAVGERSTLQGECNASRVCPASARSDVDAFSRNTTVSTIAFSAGAVGLIATAYFLLHPPGGGAAAQSGSAGAAAVSAWIGVGTAGVAGSF